MFFINEEGVVYEHADAAAQEQEFPNDNHTPYATREEAEKVAATYPDGSPKFKVPTYEGEDYSTSGIYEAISELHRDLGTWGSLDGADPIGDNIKRAKFAAEAVRAYAKETGIYDGESIFLAMTDLMNDLRHLLDFAAVDEDHEASDGYPVDLVDMAYRDTNYEAEIRGEL